MFVCCLCSSFSGHLFSAILRHIGEIHQHDPNLTIECGIEGCPQTYKNFESFRSHVYRKHRDVLHLQTERSHTSTSQIQLGQLHLHGETPPTSPSPRVVARSNVAGRFIMKIREEYNIPQSTVNKLLEDVTALCLSTLDQVKHDVLHEVIGIENSQGLICESFENITLPFQGLETEYKQTSYYKDNFNYLVGVNLYIGVFMIIINDIT